MEPEIVLALAGAAVVGGAAWLGGVYTALVRLRALVRASWGQLDAELARRHELVPNLLACVRAVAGGAPDAPDDAGLGARVAAVADADARTRAVASRSPAERGGPEAALHDALEALFAVAASRPRLAADASFAALRQELGDLHDRVVAGGRLYNDAVSRLAARRAAFPASLVARLGGVDVPAPLQRRAGAPSGAGVGT